MSFRVGVVTFPGSLDDRDAARAVNIDFAAFGSAFSDSTNAVCRVATFDELEAFLLEAI